MLGEHGVDDRHEGGALLGVEGVEEPQPLGHILVLEPDLLEGVFLAGEEPRIGSG